VAGLGNSIGDDRRDRCNDSGVIERPLTFEQASIVCSTGWLAFDEVDNHQTREQAVDQSHYPADQE